MRKEIFKEVPTTFHEQFMSTLEHLEDEKTVAYKKNLSVKRMITLLAVAVALMGTMTVAATGIFKWHRTASEHLGVSEELGDKWVMEGIAKQETVVAEAEDLTIRAIQSVGMDDYYYVLFSVTAPEGIEIVPGGDWNVWFHRKNIVPHKSFSGFTMNLVGAGEAENETLWEARLYPEPGIDCSGEEVTIQMEDLVAYERAATYPYTKLLIDGTWEIGITLPQEVPEKNFYNINNVVLGVHELKVNRVKISASMIQWYVDYGEWRHASFGEGFQVEGIRYRDGSIVKEDGSYWGMSIPATVEDNQESVLIMSLSTAVDVDQVEAILLTEGEVYLQQEQPQALDVAAPNGGLTDGEQMTVLYEKYGHALVHDEHKLYLWDKECSHAEKLVDLEAIDFDKDGGSRFLYILGKLYVLPFEESEQAYVYTVQYHLTEEEKVRTISAEEFWDTVYPTELIDGVESIFMDGEGNILEK